MHLRDLGHYLRDAAVPRWRRSLVFVAAAYALMPFDLIPDAIPVLGWLDDVGVIAAVLAFVSRDVARHARLTQRGEVVVDAIPSAR
jgi:uncharacterized membrane protein YkvA (DUF1232 family)